MKFNLFVDTSIQGGFLALYAEAKGKNLLWEGSIADNRKVSCDMTSLFKRSLAESSLSIDDLKAVVVSRGPGSFTGIRVGLSWVQGLCLGREDVDLIGSSSFSQTLLGVSQNHKASCWQRVVISDTKVSGYEVVSSPSGEVKTQVISLLPDDLKMRLQERPCDRNYIQSSIEIGEEWEESSELIKIERAEIARYAFLGMTSFHIQGQIQEEFSPESIEPLYYKSSSVEEKSAKI